MILKTIYRGHALRNAVGIMALSISGLLDWTNALPGAKLALQQLYNDQQLKTIINIKKMG